ncbi:hypothetical protein IAT38_001166 [Cryptococcus sp. DSM 104549]
MALPSTPATVAGTLVFYMISAIGMTLLNKLVLSSTSLPVFLLMCQAVVSGCLMALANAVGPLKSPKFDLRVARKLIPLTLVSVCGLLFNNACLQYVDASFHQVARGLVLPFTILITTIVLQQYPSPLSLLAAFVVTLGFFSGVLFDPDHSSAAVVDPVSVGGVVFGGLKMVGGGGEGGWVSAGIVYGVASSVLSACHAIFIQKGLTMVNNSPVALSYYNNILTSLVLIPFVILSGELAPVIRMFTTELSSPDSLHFLEGAALTGVFSFLISLASFLSIKVTSPVTHMISSAARGVVQTVLAMWIFGDVMSRGRVISIILIISGSIFYVYARSEEAKRAKALPNGRSPPRDHPSRLEGGEGRGWVDEKDRKKLG